MLDKIRNILVVILACFMLFAVVFSIFRIISNEVEDKDLITSEEVCLYTISSNLVTNYSKYYYFESCFENLIKSCELGEYDKLYNIYMDDYVEQYTKAEIISKLKNIVNKDSENTYDVKDIYLVNGIYLLQTEINGQDISLLFSQSIAKNIDYEFAFIK